MQSNELIGKTTVFRRYKKLREDIIELGDGSNPPADLINPDYKQQPGNSRKCIECGKWHDTIVEDTRTGERLKEIDKCKDCIFYGQFIPLENLPMPDSIKEWNDSYLEACGVCKNEKVGCVCMEDDEIKSILLKFLDYCDGSAECSFYLEFFNGDEEKIIDKFLEERKIK